MARPKRRSDCPINFALELFGDKWTLLIIRDLMFKGKHYYGEFQRMEENIATNILADRLAQLEDAGIVSRTIDQEHNSRKIYRLTQKGIDLLPVLTEVILWSARYDAHSAVDQRFVQEAEADKEGMLQRIKASFENSDQM